MKKSREQRQKELQAKANEIIEQLLDWTDDTEKPDLTQMEDEILKLREELSRAMLDSILTGQEDRQPAEGEKCPQCGRPLRFKGRRKEQIESRIGVSDLARGYYYCPKCQTGIFPPGSTTTVE